MTNYSKELQKIKEIKEFNRLEGHSEQLSDSVMDIYAASLKGKQC